jgi:AraC-like DNA-binding protein
LNRAAELLRMVEAEYPAPRQEAKGGLAPWQVRKVTVHVETHLDRSLRSSELATVVRLSPCHFSRAFRNSFGCSPLEYVTLRRVEQAQGLMLSTDAPLSQIALDCGMADQAHFSRMFRRYVGESPRAWRRARLGAGEAPAGRSVASPATQRVRAAEIVP